MTCAEKPPCAAQPARVDGVAQERGPQTGTDEKGQQEKPRQWQHYALTFDGTQLLVFRNAEQVYQRPLAAKAQVSENPVYVGFSDGWAGKFKGQIGLARIYNEALSPDFIQKNHRRLANGSLPLRSQSVVLEAPTFPRFETQTVLAFNGADSLIALPRRPGLNPERSLTLGAWIRTAAPPGPHPVIANGNGKDHGYQFILYGSKLSAVLVTADGIHWVHAPKAIAKDQWQNVGLAWNGRTAQLFKDGTPIGKPTLVTGELVPWTGDLLVGADASEGGRHYEGEIAEVRVFGRCAVALADIPQDVGREIVTPALNTDPDNIIGPRSRHLVGQTEKRKPLIDFEDLTGWRTVSYDGVTRAKIIRSRERPLWSDYVAKIVFGTDRFAHAKRKSVRILPPEPVTIPNAFDSINLWVFARYWGYPEGVAIRAHLRDAAGKEHELDLSSNPRWVFWNGWYIANRSTPKSFKPGAQFLGFTLHSFADKPDQVIFLDSLDFYTRDRSPLPSNVPQWSELPFPTTPDTILPSLSKGARFHNRVSQEGTRASLSYKTLRDIETIEWRYEPKTGTLSDIEIIYRNGTPFRPARDGGLIVELDGEECAVDDPRIKKRLLSFNASESSVRAKWEYRIGGDSFPVEFALTPKGKSLIVDVTAETGLVSEVRVGGYQGPQPAKAVQVPFLGLRGCIHKSQDPGVVYTDDFFLSAFLDWYNSDASELFGIFDTADPRHLTYNGGAVYYKKNDGKRNAVRERIFFTVSDRFAEVLPNIPNPPSPFIEQTKNVFWVTRPWYMNPGTYEAIKAGKQPGYYDQEFTFWKKVHDYGVRDLYIRRHVALYRQYLPWNGDPYTLVTATDPRCGGDDKLAECIRGIQDDLGYRIGLYTNYTLISPMAYSVWDENLIARDRNGEWQYGSVNCAMLKPSRALDMQQRFAPILKKRFNTTCSYQDQITARALWACVDYDHRAEGAGTFNATFRVHGKLLDQERKIYGGPVLSEGYRQWMFAGLTDANYAQSNSMAQPGLVDFQLLKIRPLQNDCNLLYTPDRVDALTAYGLLHGVLGHVRLGGKPPAVVPRNFLKAIFMIQPIQRRYAGVPVKEIRYADKEGKLLTTEEAIRAETWKLGRVKILYENDLEIYVNRGKEDWPLPDADGPVTLPQDGYLALLPGLLFAFSAIINDHHVDFLDAGDRFYWDGRGAETDISRLRARHAYIISGVSGDNDAFWLIPAPFQAEETIALTDPINLEFEAKILVTAFDRAGKEIGPANFQVTPDKLTITIEPGIFKYLIRQP